MKLRAVLVIATLSAAACTVGGVTVSLGGGQLQSGGGLGGAGDSAASGGAGLGSSVGGDTGTGGLMVTPGPFEPTCPAGETTSISGTVWDPAGTVPLYNAVVFVPKETAQLDPFKPNVACEKCKDPVPARAVTLSGPDGTFKLENTPAGGVDVVVQVGKWRRRQTVKVDQCIENKISKEFTRLPRNQGEGDIPKIAVSTGHSDALECLLRKIGIDDAEFTTDAGQGRVNMYVGCEADNPDAVDHTKHTGASHFNTKLHGASFPSTNQLFDAGKLSQYDVLVFSCEGHKCDSIQTDPHIAQLVDFANMGGRVFLDHEHYNWIKRAVTPIKKAAQFDHSPADDIPSPLTTQVNRLFPKGDAFAQWLQVVNHTSQAGTLDIYTAQSSVTPPLGKSAQRWVYRDDVPTGEFYFTIGTPVAASDDDPAPEACGRVVFTDLHLSKAGGGDPTAIDISDQNTPFPDGCTPSPLSAQEKALEFMFFDLTSCVQQDDAVPTPPVVK
jgi:hypothetical protein